MKRRTAIFSIAALATGALATFSGMRWYSSYKSPDLKYLQNNIELIGELADVIIPPSDTGGAKQAMVAETVVALLRDAPKTTQNNFINGLQDVKQYCRAKYNASFAEISAREKYETVLYFSRMGKNNSYMFAKMKMKMFGHPFFYSLKQYTTIAFCTSRSGATETLAYDHNPGSYERCTTLKPGQRSWATK